MAHLNSRPRTPEVCPVCGEDVPPRALACPECGADHKSGWREGAMDADGLGLPDEEFNYDEFVKKEFSKGGGGTGIKPIWWITAVILLVAMGIWIYLGVM
jgi:hypothetical protein